ncbi:PP2C family protein-serine/threonine phosphatase [Streptomyces thermodiastaticus]|jgi:hypothetical protein|uniref:PP2C family protein-serine/threonine phosphatase n=1 Tax=Streptomyces thermodiastaticus TaxID=44061 RepID=UPI001678003E|nr:PP2C family protein-serine/threonine phosphatase [Streptomyces thermodiastaticus]MCE7553027.1 serine/threonine-protein phosphatase [Streptomyces thermodiastaticus]
MLSHLPARRDPGRRGWLSGAPPPRWIRALPVGLAAVVGAVALLSPGPVDIGFVLGAIPPLAVLSYGPVATTLMGAVALVLLTAPVFRLGHPGDTDLETVCFVAVLSVFLAFVRSRRDAQLDLERTVAEAAQRAVMPSLPPRVGPVRCVGLYRAAQRGTLVGGDFFDVRAGPYGVRAVLGDVQGHGLAAVATVAALLGSFREAVLDRSELTAVAAALDRRLVVETTEVRQAELFATAALLEFSSDARSVQVITCGHPPPVLLRDGRAAEIEVEPWTPLGLGLSGGVPRRAGRRVVLRPGDVLFLASDGVFEARDAHGAFYPLLQRLPRLAGEDPAGVAGRVLADVLAHCGTVRDDVTMLVLTPCPPDGPPAAR